VLLAFGGPASAQGIKDTRHNLGAATGGTTIADRNQVNATGTQEVCVFCHTPHGSVDGAPAPLWNKRLVGAGNTYNTYNTGTSGSIEGAVAPVGGVSMACLSCHDGTQAMDNIINAPGSGQYDATGGGPNGRTGAAWAWTGSNVNAEGLLSGVARLGDGTATVDLTNDHPIGIQYCGGGISATGTGNCNDPDFRAPVAGLVNTQTVLWVDTNGGTTKQRSDLPLYPGRDGVIGPMVECATCHDPHVKSGEAVTNGVAAGETFLRISNASSAVCTACHVK
jgi:hypothetical protein